MHAMRDKTKNINIDNVLAKNRRESDRMAFTFACEEKFWDVPKDYETGKINIKLKVGLIF